MLTPENQLPPPSPTQAYRSLVAIQDRKEQLRREIQKDDREIKTLWRTLFKKEESPTKGLRVAGLMNTGAGVLDGLILGWKLYRKYKGIGRKKKK